VAHKGEGKRGVSPLGFNIFFFFFLAKNFAQARSASPGPKYSSGHPKFLLKQATTPPDELHVVKILAQARLVSLGLKYSSGHP